MFSRFSGCWDPKAIPVEHLFRATILAIELGMMEQRTQILGGVAIFDLEAIGTQHAWQITPSVASKIVKMLVVRYWIFFGTSLKTWSRLVLDIDI